MYRSGVLCLLILTVTSAPIASAADAKVYKTRDKDGNVVFSDVPPASVEEASKAAIEVKVPNTYETRGQGQSAADNREPWIVGEDESAEFIPYATLQVAFPANDAPLRDNTGNVTVQITIEPLLTGSHRLRLLMDGTTAGEDSATSFMLPNVDRGTHSLQVQVIDEDGKVLQSSETSTFHLQRYHLPPKKPAPPKKTAP